MRTDPREMLAVGMVGAGSRLGRRIETLVRGGRTFTARASASTVIASAIALAGLTIAGSLAPRWIAFAQDARPAFEVASIKPSTCDTNRLSGAPSPDRLSVCRPLRDTIDFAYAKHYGVNHFVRAHVLGGPAWIDTETWDIEAKAARAYPEPVKNGPMMQQLLEDRFRLQVHRETRTVPIYELTVAKGGPRLQGAKPGSCTTVDRDKPPPRGQLPDRPCGGNRQTNGRIEMFGATMADFSGFLSGGMDRDVVDRTGISGAYDIQLILQPNPDPPGAEPNEPGPVGGVSGIIRNLVRDEVRAYDGMVAPAVEQQLGLKLVSATGPDEFIVIDHIERPSPN